MNKIGNADAASLRNINIVLGVSGGIAAYKACDLTSKLKKLEANIDVIMTKSAAEFVTPLTFQSLSLNQVAVDMFDAPKYWEIEHISLAKKADLMVIAPATANIIGKLAGGIADDMLTTTAMATKAPILIAPAMNVNMYENPIVQRNIEALKALGYIFAEPGAGRLACGDIGKGKMAEPAEIVEKILQIMSPKRDLEGRTVIVTAGPTREAIDPVRYISNHSSGKMGYAIADRAARRGARVILVSGPANLSTPESVTRVDVESTSDMLEGIMRYFEEADIIIKGAAPADYAPLVYSQNKIKKSEEELVLRLKKNPDIAAELGRIKGSRILVGFAAETNDLIENAKAKIEKKNFDFIVANDVTIEGAGFGTDTNLVKLIDREGNIDELPMMKKSEIADIILDRISELIRKRA
ncbi:MAG: bifunctional phosphopantothenoylcysteine decarboxylase/phosphopantothenate--cysteine ligase CoaBC [Bacillota bacterium]